MNGKLEVIHISSLLQMVDIMIRALHPRPFKNLQAKIIVEPLWLTIKYYIYQTIYIYWCQLTYVSQLLYKYVIVDQNKQIPLIIISNHLNICVFVSFLFECKTHLYFFIENTSFFLLKYSIEFSLTTSYL